MKYNFMKRATCMLFAIAMAIPICNIEASAVSDTGKFTINDVMNSTDYISYINNYHKFYDDNCSSRLRYRSKVVEYYSFLTYYDIDCSGRVDIGDAQVFLYDYTIYMAEQPEEKSNDNPEYKKFYDDWLYFRMRLIRHNGDIPLEGTRTKPFTEYEEILPDGETYHPKNSLEVAQYLLYYYANGVLMDDVNGWFFYGDVLSFTAHSVKDTMWVSDWIRKKHPNFARL